MRGKNLESDRSSRISRWNGRSYKKKGGGMSLMKNRYRCRTPSGLSARHTHLRPP